MDMKQLDKNEMMQFLEMCGCENVRLACSEGYCRDIIFEVYGRTYSIEWFINESTLFCGDITKDERCPQFHFKYIRYDSCCPIKYDGNSNISFFMEHENGHPAWGRTLRLPIDKPKIHASELDGFVR